MEKSKAMANHSADGNYLTTDKISALIKALSAPPSGKHLEDNEFVNYVLGIVEPDKKLIYDDHIDTCLECAEHLEFMYESKHLWDTKESRVMKEVLFRIENTEPNKPDFSRVVLELLNKLVNSIMPETERELALAKPDESQPMLETKIIEKNGVKIKVFLDYKKSHDDLIIRFSTKTLDQGNSLILTDDNHGFRLVVVLKVIGKELFGEAQLSKANCLKLKNPDFRLSLEG